MDNDKIAEYLLKNEQLRYEAHKELCKTVRWFFIALFACIAVLGVAYMYWVIPVEEVEIDNGSKAVIHATVDNGSNVWQ